MHCSVVHHHRRNARRVVNRQCRWVHSGMLTNKVHKRNNWFCRSTCPCMKRTLAKRSRNWLVCFLFLWTNICIYFPFVSQTFQFHVVQETTIRLCWYRFWTTKRRPNSAILWRLFTTVKQLFQVNNTASSSTSIAVIHFILILFYCIFWNRTRWIPMDQRQSIPTCLHPKSETIRTRSFISFQSIATSLACVFQRSNHKWSHSFQRSGHNNTNRSGFFGFETVVFQTFPVFRKTRTRRPRKERRPNSTKPAFTPNSDNGRINSSCCLFCHRYIRPWTNFGCHIHFYLVIIVVFLFIPPVVNCFIVHNMLLLLLLRFLFTQMFLFLHHQNQNNKRNTKRILLFFLFCVDEPFKTIGNSCFFSSFVFIFFNIFSLSTCSWLFAFDVFVWFFSFVLLWIFQRKKLYNCYVSFFLYTHHGFLFIHAFLIILWKVFLFSFISNRKVNEFWLIWVIWFDSKSAPIQKKQIKLVSKP